MRIRVGEERREEKSNIFFCCCCFRINNHLQHEKSNFWEMVRVWGGEDVEENIFVIVVVVVLLCCFKLNDAVPRELT